MRYLLSLILIASLTSCSLMQRSEHQVIAAFAEAAAQYDMATICELASNEVICAVMWEPILRGQYERGKLGTYTITGDRVCYAGGAGIRVQLNHERRIMQLYHLRDCPALEAGS